MDVLHEIIRDSAAGQLSAGLRTMVLSLFVSIVLILIGMLGTLLFYGNQVPIQFGY